MRLAVAAVAAGLLVAAAGCGKPVLRLADASMGDYYTEKEYQKLNEEQREEYCNELADQRGTFEAEIADAGEALDALTRSLAQRRAEADSLMGVAERLEEQVRTARAEGARRKEPSADVAPSRPAAAGTYVVKRGDSLWRISGLPETLGRPAEWTRIHEANRSRIADPNLIYPGQELTIPR